MRIEPKKIMCAIDFSEFTNITLSYGIAWAKEFGAQLSLCHVVAKQLTHTNYAPSYIDFQNYETYEKDQICQAKKRLENLVKSYDLPIDVIVIAGHSADEIGRIAVEKDIDLVIAATHGHSGIKRFLIGSVTERLIKTLPCPLLVLHAQKIHFVSQIDHHIHLKKILVGCDFSPDSTLAFEYALSLAQEFQTELHLAHVLKPSDSFNMTPSDHMMFQTGDAMRWNQSNLQTMNGIENIEKQEKKNILLSRLEKKLLNMIPEECNNWCTPATILLEGTPYQELINYSEHKNIDLIVLGIHGHSLLENLLIGSTTDRVIRRASCSILAVRQAS